VGAGPPATGWRALRTDARLRAVALFLFPALIWMLSAPLVTAAENAVSLFLLRKVVTVVFTVFNLLGYPLLQEGNVLVLPHGQVGVADACSGIRSLTGCLFAGSFLAAVFLDKLWKKILLIGLAMGFAFLTNLLRSLFLTAWAYAYGSDAIEGRLHDATGFAVLGLTVVGLFCLLPLFHTANWRRWLGLEPESNR
jgi:exosortase